ncbi:MAG: AraC family transcriptional regulator [Cyanobacteria bacterium P01_F01_bin.153]
MTIKLTDSEFDDLFFSAQQRGESLLQPLEFGEQVCLPTQLGTGGDRNIQLRNGFDLSIRQCRLRQNLHCTMHHEADFPLVAKFYLSGSSRMRSPGILDVEPDYEEIKGHHYLYHLPNQTEVEEWPANELINVVYLCADPSYFSSFDGDQTALSPLLQKLIAGDRTQRFHKSLGRITPRIKQLLQQILHCPHTGLMKQMYLEGKVLELFATQFELWAEDSTSQDLVSLSAQDIEQLYQAKEILIENATQPPSLGSLARQIGLNDRKLNRGFRQLFGTTVFGYLQDHRLQQAQELLRNSRLTVAGVATAIGYKSPEAFSTAFRRKFAINPKSYQLSLRR